VDLKRALIAQLDAAAPHGTPIASSSSGLPASTFVEDCSVRRERVLIGHPFNPPHLVPLVEIVPHAITEEGIINTAQEFYASLGKKPIVLRKEAPGFVANRSQSALLKEAMSIVVQGIATAEDVGS
jgi:3-hydroxyacyl-CoA dehydrogenase